MALFDGNIHGTYSAVYNVAEYLDEKGRSPFARWLEKLDKQAASKVVVAVMRMRQGNLSNVKWFKGIGEYRIDVGPGYRIYLGKAGEKLIILLGGGTKKKQQSDIEAAFFAWNDYKKRT